MKNHGDHPRVIPTAAAEYVLIRAGMLRADRVHLEVLEETQAELAEMGVVAEVRYSHVDCRKCRFNMGTGGYRASDRCAVNGERLCSDCNRDGKCEKYLRDLPVRPDLRGYFAATAVVIIVIGWLLLQ